MLKRKAMQKAKEEGATHDDAPVKEPLLLSAATNGTGSSERV